jgi:prepilin-type N-terminal cleavage/methylation domain-containing protein
MMKSNAFHARNRTRGFSLVEVMVVLAVTSIILVIVMSMIEEATRVSLFVESRNELSAMAQRPINQIQREILQANNLFDETAIGTPYRTNLESTLLVSDPQPVPDRLLPVIASGSTMVPDTVGVRQVGNALLLARKLGPISIPLAADGTYPATVFNADRYVFHYYYLSRVRTQTNAFRNSQYIVNLFRYRSWPVADYFQLANSTGNLSANQQAALATALTGAGVGQYGLTLAWNPGGAWTQSFYSIPANLTFGAPLAQPVVRRRDVVAMLPELQGGRITGKMPITIAYRDNNALLDNGYVNMAEGTGVNGRGTVPVPRFGNLNDLQNAGFELKIVGPQGSRQVMTRLVLYSNYAVTKLDAQDAIVISSFQR